MFVINLFKVFFLHLKKVGGRIIYPIFLPIINYALEANNRNIARYRQKIALTTTVKYIEQHMHLIQSFSDKFSVIEHAITHIDKKEKGIICEFGVATGRTINFIAKLLPQDAIYGFDSFEGLPEDWRDGFPRGKFKMDKLPKVRPNVKLIKGLFRETLPIFLLENKEKALFIHIDCDLYSSTKTIFEEFYDRIKPGTVLVFDEFFNYPGWQNGEFKAFMEFIDTTKHSFKYLGYNRYSEQVAIKIL